MRWMVMLVLAVAARAADDYAIVVYPAPKCAAPKLDGKLDDPCWAEAPVVSGFIWYNKNEAVPTQTSFRVCYDDQAIYLGIWCDEPALDKLTPLPLPQDAKQIFSTEAIEIFWDPDHDHQRYYQFAVNAAGSIYDAERWEASWSGQATAGAAKGQGGWGLEIRFPFAPLKLTPAPGKVLGLNLCRDRTLLKDREWSCWSQVKANFHDAERFGHVVLSPTAEQLAALGPELRKGDRSGPIRIYARGGFGAETYIGLARRSLARVVAKLKTMRQIREREAPAAAAAFDRLLAKAEAQLAPVREALDGEVDGGVFARLELQLATLETWLDQAIWEARLEALLASL